MSVSYFVYRHALFNKKLSQVVRAVDVVSYVVVFYTDMRDNLIFECLTIVVSQSKLWILIKRF